MSNRITGPLTLPAQLLHKLKYRDNDESYRECVHRCAYALQDSNDHYHAIREIMLDCRFWFGGRIQAWAGRSLEATPYNCFVSGTFADSFVSGDGSIGQRLIEAATTLRLGGGLGYDFSPLRPQDDVVRKLGTRAGGPVGFAPLFNEVGNVTSAVGYRRGAQMLMLRIDHPDIERFINAKQNSNRFNRFNFSVSVTERFLEAVEAGKDFDLKWPFDPKEPESGRVYRTIEARALWEKIMRSTWDWAEPGVFFIDRVNEMNNLWYCEHIAATNPCAEQPLPPFGACLLGSINLVRYLVPQPSKYSFDYDQLIEDIPHIVRALDNVVDRARYPLAAQRVEAVTKRRMGIGFMGLANTVEACGHTYGSSEAVEMAEKIMQIITHHAYFASAMLAKEKGEFPAFDREKYLRGKFIRSLDTDVTSVVERYGIRNSHLISIAPTGTGSMCFDNVSSGCEPVLYHEEVRPVTSAEGLTQIQVRDYGVEFLGVKGVLASEITPEQHINMLVSLQRHVDSSISKTCNIGSSITWDDFQSIYWKAYHGGAKSCSTFHEAGKREALRAPVEIACDIGPDGRRDCE